MSNCPTECKTTVVVCPHIHRPISELQQSKHEYSQKLNLKLMQIFRLDACTFGPATEKQPCDCLTTFYFDYQIMCFEKVIYDQSTILIFSKVLTAFE